MKISYKFLGNAFTLMVLFFSTGAFLSLLLDNPSLEANAEGSPLTKAFWAAVYLIVVLRVISQYRQIVPLVRANKCLCLLVLLSVLSTLWSEDSAVTLHQGVALLGTTLIAIDFAVHYSIREQLRLICIVLGSVVLLSIATQVFAPGLILHVGSDLSAWQGVFSHKNTFGRIVVLTAAAFLSRPRHSRRDTLLTVTLMVIAGAVVVATRSAGSLVTLAAVLLIYSAIAALRWRPATLTITGVGALLIVIPTVYLALDNLDAVTAMLGRNATLTGRAELWRFTVANIAKSPALGYGYRAFWNVSSQEATRIRGVIGWEAPTAHNGYLDLLLDLGFVGLFLYGTSYLVTVRRAVTIFRRDPAQKIIWPLTLLSFVLLGQVVESGILAANSIFWILYVATAFSVSKPSIVTEGAIHDIDSAEFLYDGILTEA
jgi:O-antigen ligase